jgi:hypothetical protein
MSNKRRGWNGGRKPRRLSASEKYLMKEFSDQLEELRKKPEWTIERIAKELQICRASLYNYLNRSDLARPEVMRRSQTKLGFKFKYMDFETVPIPEPRGKQPSDAQGVLPFLRTLCQDDIRVVGKKSVQRDTLELTVQIRFAG